MFRNLRERFSVEDLDYQVGAPDLQAGDAKAVERLFKQP